MGYTNIENTVGAGSIVRDFAAGENNSRNSEGAFAQLDDGRIVLVFSRYRKSSGDDDMCDLAASFSSDGGITFSDPEVVLTCEECDGVNIMSVSILGMTGGRFGMFYLKKTVDGQCRMFLRRTYDFRHFSEENICIADRGYFVVNNDRVVRLRNGRIIIPSAYTELNGKKSSRNVARAIFYASDDDGKSFRKLSEQCLPFRFFVSAGAQEPGIIELGENNIAVFYRNNTGRQYISYSYDNAETWTVPEPSRFTSPVSPMSAKKLRDGRVVAVYNPIPLYYGRGERINGVFTGARTPLTASLCRSDLNDEYKVLLLEDDPMSGYCYTAIFETDGAILLAYCAGSVSDGSTLNRLRIRRISKEELA